MKIEITCPSCGYNSYKALNNRTGAEVEVVISKCADGSFNIDVVKDSYYEAYDSFDEVQFNYSLYTLLEVTGSNCVSPLRR